MSDSFAAFDATSVPSPCLVLNTARLDANLARLRAVRDGAGVTVLLALKAFSCFAVAERIGRCLDGTAASGLWEARLGATRFQGPVHAYVPGLKDDQVDEIQTYADHLIFNSLGRFRHFQDRLTGGVGVGLRVNPRHSESAFPIYDPCAPWSRLGMAPDTVAPDDLDGVDGLHVHALCDQGYAPFDRLLSALETRFDKHLDRVDWVNLGGGQLLTADDYPADALIERLADFKARRGVDVYLEPGTAVAYQAGALVCEVLDTGWNDGCFAIVDASATCHMPDVIEAPYTPEVAGAEIVETPTPDDAADACVVRLGGPTCLAGDIIGTYRFAEPPKVGDRLVIRDQGYYTTVKATTFNGTPLPALALWDGRADSAPAVFKTFGYDDFERRLG
jgi:carboxynorspermidine decarboxylase